MSILPIHYYLLLGSMLLFLNTNVSGKVVFLHGTACAGKTSLCNAMVKQSDEWKMVSDDDIFIERAALRWKTEFPTEFCAVEAAIDIKNIFHAVMRNQILFRTDASLQERLNAQNAMITIRQELNSRPKSDPADPHSWSNLLRNQITQIIIDQAEQAHVIVESWFLKEEHIAQIAEKYEVIHVAAYCTFSDMIKRVMKRNYDALMLGKDISSLRFFHQALMSFTGLYYLSDNPEGAIDVLFKKDVIHALDLVRACLHDSPDSTGSSQSFTRGEISLSEFEQYQHNLLSSFTADTAYVIPKFKVDGVIRTDHKSATESAQHLLKWNEEKKECCSMKVYVSAKFDDKERVKELYTLLKQQGHTITHEWIHNKPSYPFDVEPEYTAQCAAEDFNGVLASDVFILLSNAQQSMGASGELGAAIASFLIFKKPHIYVVGPHFNTNFCFYHPAVVQKNSIEEVMNDIDTIIPITNRGVASEAV